MEDHRKYRTQSANHNDEKIVELTQEMALPDQSDGDIIDLTRSIDDAGAPPAEKIQDPVAEEAGTPPAEPQLTGDPEAATTRPIEEEVDAAFDAAQTPSPAGEEQAAVADDHLFDKLTGITEKVDDAVRQSETPPASADDAPSAGEPAPAPENHDEASIAAAAAEFDAAMDEEIVEDVMELTDVVEPAAEAADADIPEDDDVLELTDMVDHEDAPIPLVEEPEGNDFIELTDRAESAETAADKEDDEAVLDLTDMVDPADAPIPLADELEGNDFIELTDMVESAQTDADEEDDEAVLDLTERVDLADASIPLGDEPGDDDVIELTDMVDPEDAPIPLMEEPEGDDFIELTDRVESAESAADEEDDEAVLDLTDMVSPEDMVQDEPETASMDDAAPPSPVEAESEAIADMFMEEMATAESNMDEHDRSPVEPEVGIPLTEVAEPADEQVIQLSDVLGQADKGTRLPIEKIKMGAEEDLASQPISLEREDTANALGLNLEMQQKIETAVEHLLETKYADTINQLISDAVEKAVSREFAAIKGAKRDNQDSED